LHHHPFTIPSRRLPHVWLNPAIPAARIGTIDLAGHGAFCLLTGVGGDTWETARRKLSKQYGIPINAYSISWRQDWEDVYGTWERVRGVEEDRGALARPDRFVYWRPMQPVGGGIEAAKQLERVVKSILSLS